MKKEKVIEAVVVVGILVAVSVFDLVTGKNTLKEVFDDKGK